MPAWHWDAPRCCPEFYGYNLTSNVRALHTERRLNLYRSGSLTVVERKHQYVLLKSRFVYKKAVVWLCWVDSEGWIPPLTPLTPVLKVSFVKICITPLLFSLAGVCSFIGPDGKRADCIKWKKRHQHWQTTDRKGDHFCCQYPLTLMGKTWSYLEHFEKIKNLTSGWHKSILKTNRWKCVSVGNKNIWQYLLRVNKHMICVSNPFEQGT